MPRKGKKFQRMTQLRENRGLHAIASQSQTEAESNPVVKEMKPCVSDDNLPSKFERDGKVKVSENVNVGHDDDEAGNEHKLRMNNLQDDVSSNIHVVEKPDVVIESDSGDCILIEEEPSMKPVQNAPFTFQPPTRSDMECMCLQLGHTIQTNRPYQVTSSIVYRGSGLLLSENVRCKNISGGGPCFFKSMSYVITGTEDYHSDLRTRLFHFESMHPQKVKPHLHMTEQIPDTDSDTGTKIVPRLPTDLDVSQHLTNLRRQETWAQTLDLIAMAAMLRVEIFCLTPKDPDNYPDENMHWLKYSPSMFGHENSESEGQGPNANMRIYIRNTSGTHFDCVVQVRNPTVKTPRIRNIETCQRVSRLRELESEEQRSTRLGLERDRYSRYCFDESDLPPGSESERSRRTRESVSRHRARESADKRSQRLSKERVSTSLRREMESEHEKLERLRKVRQSMSLCREMESEPKKLERLDKDSRSKRISREHESPDTKARRLFARNAAQKNLRKSLNTNQKRITKELDRLRKRRKLAADRSDIEKTLKTIRNDIEKKAHCVYICTSDLRYHHRSSVVELRLPDLTEPVAQERGSDKHSLRPQIKKHYNVNALDTATEADRKLKDARLRDLCILNEQTKSWDERHYICKACKTTIESGGTPRCNEVVHQFRVEDLPEELKDDPLNKTEAHILKLIVPFTRVTHIPRSAEFKVIGPLICVQSQVKEAIEKILPIDQELIPVCFKRKLDYKGSYTEQVVDKAKILRYFEYLKNNNHLYSDIELDVQKLDQMMDTVMQEVCAQDDRKTRTEEENIDDGDRTSQPDAEQPREQSIDNEVSEDGNVQMGEDGPTDPESNYDLPEYLTEMTDDTVIDSLDKTKTEDNIISAYAEGIIEAEKRHMNQRKGKKSKKIPAVSMAPSESGEFVNWSEIDDDVKYIEEKSFPDLFPNGTGGYLSTYVDNEGGNVTRSVDFANYIKQRILGVDSRFREDSTYMFFLFLVKERIEISRSVTTFFRKSKVDKKNFDVKFFRDADRDEIRRTDLGYNAFQNVRGTAPYFKQMKLKLQALIRQLGSPQLFLTMSAAESKWQDLLLMLLQKERKSPVSMEEVDRMSKTEIYKLLSRNVVETTQHFSNRIRTIYTAMKKPGILAQYKTVDHFFRVEFQHRGSPHIHSLLWLEDENGDKPPTYNSGSPESKEKCEAFIDSVISARTYPEWDDPTGYASTYQRHAHTFTCKKKGLKIRIRSDEGHGRNDGLKTGKELMLDCCRFNYPYFPIRKTTIVERPKSDEAEDEISKWRSNYLKARKFILRQTEDRSESMKPFDELSFDEFLEELGLTENEYLDCLKMSARSKKSGAQVYLQRECADVFTNNFNPNILKVNQSNMDIQFVLDEYACCAYILGYLTKNESGLSRLLHEIEVESQKYGHSPEEKIKKFARALDNSREVSRPEVVYRMLGLHFCESTRTHTFIQSSHPKNRDGLLKDKATLDQLADDEDAFQNNPVDYYINRPDGPEYDNLSLAEFFRDYRIAYESKAEKAAKKLYDTDADISDRNKNGKFAWLKNAKGRIQKNAKNTIVRYYLPRSETEIKRSQLVLFHPFRDEMAEIHECPNKTIDDLYAQYKDDIELVRREFEPNRQLMLNLENAMEEYELNGDEDDSIDDELICSEEIGEKIENSEPEETTDEADLAHFISLAGRNKVKEIDVTIREEVCGMIRKLNRDQRRIFDDVMERLTTYSEEESDSLNLYLSGRAGTGKSYLLRVLIEASKLMFMKSGNDLDKPTVLVLCPTAVAAHIVGGETIESALKMFRDNQHESVDIFGSKHEIAYKYSQLKAIFIDEISMVGTNKLHTIHLRLQEIFKERTKPFGGIPVICSGDFLQLPPVLDRWIFEQNSNTECKSTSINKWKSYFKMYELTEKMRSLDDPDFSSLCDRIGTNQLSDDDINTLQSRVVQCDDENSNEAFKSGDLAIIVKDNETRETINLNKLTLIDGDEHTFQARDVCTNVNRYNADAVRSMSYTSCGGLPQSLTVKVDAPVMLTVNLFKEEGLANGTRGYIVDIDTARNIIWVKFPEQIGVKQAAIGRRKYNFQGMYGAVPITKTDCSFSANGNCGSVYIKRKQFPLVLSYAITSHKSQGLTLGNVIIDFSGKCNAARGSFYVAATRVKQLRHLFLRNFETNMIQTDGRVLKELTDLGRPQRQYVLSNLPVAEHGFLFDNETDNDELKLCYLNINGFFDGRHNLDLDADMNLNSANFVCISETKLGIDTDDDDVDLTRLDFLGRLDNRHGSMGMLVLESVDTNGTGYDLIDQHHDDDRCQFMRCRIQMFGSHIYHIIFAYIHPNHITVGLLKLSEIIEEGDIVMGDLNIDSLSEEGLRIMHNFCIDHHLEDAVLGPTRQAAHLDHILVPENPSYKWYAQTVLNFYSDHKAIILRLSKKASHVRR